MAAFGVLLASFPARNLDLWKYLAEGRALLRGVGGFDASWLYSAASYGVFSLTGGSGLVALKALLCGVAAVLMFHMSGRKAGWRIALAVTGLAVLAMGNRLLLQPATVSVLFLAITLWLLLQEETRPPEESRIWPGWKWVVLFVLWANIDSRFILGLGVVALTWLGRLLDSPQPGGFGPTLVRRVGSLAILVAVACVSPAHVNGLRPPVELKDAVEALRKDVSTDSPIHSPFSRDYLTFFRDSPAALSYYPLLVLGLVSFLLNRRVWKWSWFLPWMGLAVVSGLQGRLVPLFAVVAGPVTAWNLHEYFARRESSAPVRPRVRFAGLGLIVLLAAAFLVAAWPGWLQGPPFEPRRWAIDTPVALPRGADFLRKSHTSNLWPAGTRTLHVSPDTASALAWFCPEDHSLRDDDAVAALLKVEELQKARARLRELGVNRVVVYVGDSGVVSLAMLDRLLLEPEEWPVLHLKGGFVVFGWRDPARSGGGNPYAGWEVDFSKLAFRPDESEVAPSARPTSKPHWSDAFWKPAPPSRSPGRDESTVFLRKAESLRRTAPLSHQLAWEVAQSAGLVGAAGGWTGLCGPVDAMLRLGTLDPPIPETGPLPPITRLTFGLNQRFIFQRGDAPVGVLYCAIRAARRAVAENSADANAYFALGGAYGALLTTTSERSWATQHPEILRLRQIQASAALNRAVSLNPKLAAAHVELARLYTSLNCLDLVVFHLRAYQEIPPRWGGPRKDDPNSEAIESELNRLTKIVDRETAAVAKETGRSVLDRALMANQRGLGGQARDLLLTSDVSAFGKVGMELEIDLLLRTGRPEDVLEWMTEELRSSLGDFTYHWLRTQAFAAVGDYDFADAELVVMIGSGGRLPAHPQVSMELARLVGTSLLDEQAGVSYLPQLLIRTLSRNDTRTRIADIAQTLGLRAEVLVIRGLVALEAGNIPCAREAFRESLVFSPTRWGSGQLVFDGRLVAWDCLALIDP